MTIDFQKLWILAPRAIGVYRLAFEDVAAVFDRFGINSDRRAVHFFAQALHETGGLKILTENLNYSAERLMVVWPNRFADRSQAEPFAHNPRALANRVYGNRMGNTGPDDGWRYIGRGLLQLTGRNNYTRVGRELGLDLVNNPNLAEESEHLLEIACAEWRLLGCNSLADTDSLARVTLAINGGLTGIASRRDWLTKVKEQFVPA
jgi:putative chitinase